MGLEGLKMLRFGADVERGNEMKIRIGNEYYIEDQAVSEPEYVPAVSGESVLRPQHTSYGYVEA